MSRPGIYVTTTFKQLGQEHRQEKQPCSRDTLSRSRSEKEDEFIGNCCESKMRLRQDWKKERSRHAFEVVTRKQTGQ